MLYRSLADIISGKTQAIYQDIAMPIIEVDITLGVNTMTDFVEKTLST